MVTIQSADSALKSFYLDAVTEALNLKANPLLAQLERTENNVVGKDVRRSVRYGVGGGVSAGSETGDLPASAPAQRLQLVAPLKNLYGTIEISDKAIRAASTNEGAFVNLLNDEMQSLVQNAKFNFGRMLYGDGRSKIATVVATNGSSVVFDAVNGFVEGMLVDFMDETFLPYEEAKGCKVLAVNNATNSVIFDKPDLTAIIDDGSVACLQGSKNYELTGLDAIFSDEDIYGHARSESGLLKATVKTNIGDFSEEILQKAIDDVEERTGVKTNFIVCSWGVKRAIVKYYRENGLALSTMQVAGGYQALDFNGVPIVVDRFCPKGTMYLLNTDDFKIHQLCDWKWLEGEDGKILKQVPGKPVYTATLVKYAELMCDRPNAQVKLTDITEA